jgi:hypothetical protein
VQLRGVDWPPPEIEQAVQAPTARVALRGHPAAHLAEADIAQIEWSFERPKRARQRRVPGSSRQHAADPGVRRGVTTPFIELSLIQRLLLRRSAVAELMATET